MKSIKLYTSIYLPAKSFNLLYYGYSYFIKAVFNKWKFKFPEKQKHILKYLIILK